ncbi:MAG: recombination protein RecR [Cyclobacteriaceae bacterium]|jgi:recombination protein RecR
MNFPSKLVEEAVLEIARLPGIGKKTALRLVLHLLKQPADHSVSLAHAIVKMREGIRYCDECFIIADTTSCTCRRPSTDETIICVVEDTPDVLAIQNTGQYKGMFHVLGGRISPLEGIGPDELQIGSLIKRVTSSESEVTEILLALSGTMEGETTSFYITRLLSDNPVKITTIARGIPVGGELEYADEVTLGRSIAMRTLFSHES